MSRSKAFVLSLFTVFLVPLAIPSLGGSLTFSFAVLLTLLVWFSVKWNGLANLHGKGNYLEILFATALIGGNFARNMFTNSSFGLVDMLIVFVGLSLAFYGIRTFRFFILPSIYIGILIVGYQLEFAFQEVKLLEYWMAGLMSSMMQGLGVETLVFGNIVAIYGVTALFLQIAGPCTGIKGILAFGSLSSMTILDIKAKLARIILIVGIGFAGIFFMNLARLAVIFLSAHYIGIEVALSIHTYLGYGLFIVWIVIFWSFALKYLTPRNRTRVETSFRRNG